MAIRMSDQPKKKEFSLWPDAKDDATRIDFKNSGELRSAVETMATNEKRALEEKLIKDYPGLGEILNDRTLTPFKKKMAALPYIKQEVGRIRREERELTAKQEQLDFCEALLEASKEFPAWERLPPKLESNDCSRLHLLVANLKLYKKYLAEIQKGTDVDQIPWEKMVPFVVQHDWAEAFKNAGEYAEGGFNLPYEFCAFEFRITGRSFTVLACQSEGCEPNFTNYIQFGEHWVSHDKEKDYPAADFAMAQVKAICVALDAEVATRTMVRAPEKLNRKRQEDGKVPLYSYHVVNLNRRFRPSNPSPGGGVVHGKRRLHFRRGHWRHYAEFKTWVRWTLVGNPELGFIDKEYRL